MTASAASTMAAVSYSASQADRIKMAFRKPGSRSFHYFQQRSQTRPSITPRSPFYGHIKQRFFRDDIFFVMFPFYIQSRKRDVVTDNYVYPLFHLRHGNSLKGWQFWPLVGQEHKDVTTSTNGFGEIETTGGHEKFLRSGRCSSIRLWALEPENTERRNGLLPFYSVSRAPGRDSTTVIWPFFSWIDDRDKKYHEWERGVAIREYCSRRRQNDHRVFPLPDALTTTSSRAIFTSGLFQTQSRSRRPLIANARESFTFFSDLTEKNTETGSALHRTDLWPLFTHRRDHNGNSRLKSWPTSSQCCQQ
jgi:hypothetical protein